MLRKFLQHTYASQIVANTLWQLLGRAVSVGISFFATILLAKYYGPSGYGEFIQVISLVGFFYLVVDFGLNSLYLREEQTENKIWVVFVLRMVLAITSIIFISILLPFFIRSQGFSSLFHWSVLLFLPSLFFQGIIQTSSIVFQRLRRYDLGQIGVIIGNVITIVMLLIGIFYLQIAAPIIGSIAYGLGLAATACVSWYVIQRLHKMHRVWDVDFAKKLLRVSLPYAITLVANVVYAHVDTIILSFYRSHTEVGMYGLSYRIFETFLVLPTFFINAVYPILLQKRSNQKPTREFWLSVYKSFWALVIISIITLSIVQICAPLIMYIRSEFTESIYLLRVLSLYLPIFYVTSLSMAVLVSIGKQKTLAYIYGIGMVGNIIANWIFIPTFGSLASVWITGLGEFLILVASIVAIYIYAKRFS